MHTVPTRPSGSLSTYLRIQRMSSDICSSPTAFERSAAAPSSSAEPQAPRLKMTYVSMNPPRPHVGLLIAGTYDRPTVGRYQDNIAVNGRRREGRAHL